MIRLLKRAAVSGALLTGSILVGLILIEAGLRLYFCKSLVPPPATEEGLRIPHRTRGWTLDPGKSAMQFTLDYVVNVQINSKGLRDVEHEYEPEPGTFRIVVLGDSFMEAYQVNYEKSLPRLLNYGLRDRHAEVVNLGVAGYGTYQEYLYLKEEGLKYKPKLVVLSFLPADDVTDNSKELITALFYESHPRTYARGFPILDPKTGALKEIPGDFERYTKYFNYHHGDPSKQNAELNFLKRTMLYRTLQMRLGALSAKDVRLRTYDPNVYLGAYLANFDEHAEGAKFKNDEYERMWNEGWAATERVLIETNKLAEANGAKLAVLIVPRELQVEPKFAAQIAEQYPGLRLDLTKSNRRLAQFCHDNGIAIVDPLPDFIEAVKAGKGPLFHQIED